MGAGNAGALFTPGAQMTSVTLAEATAIALIREIPRYLPADFETLGITPEDFNLVAGERCWLREHMSSITRTMNALFYGVAEKLTLPKITIPAEYQAAVICAVVHRANIHACCIILAQEGRIGASVIELAQGNQPAQSLQKANADQLFALCCIMEDKADTNYAREELRRKLGIQINKAIVKGAK